MVFNGSNTGGVLLDWSKVYDLKQRKYEDPKDYLEILTRMFLKKKTFRFYSSCIPMPLCHVFICGLFPELQVEVKKQVLHWENKTVDMVMDYVKHNCTLMQENAGKKVEKINDIANEFLMERK